jgi:diadenosine tetraphosphate (Ap4A) HIT family hydrolase
MDCPFCSGKDVEARIICRDNLVFAFPSNIPITPGHTLVCPVRHISKIDDLTEVELRAIGQLIIKIKNSLKISFAAQGFNIAFNEGVQAGQSVNHLHVHIVPRQTGDQGIYKYEPREFLYSPGSREVSSEKELISVAGKIKKSLN